MLCTFARLRPICVRRARPRTRGVVRVLGLLACALGTPAAAQTLGSEFQVDSATQGAFSISSASVAMDPAGNFVVVWDRSEIPGNPPSPPSIQARRFASNGTPLGSTFQVNSLTTSAQGGYQRPVIAMDGVGNFVVLWASLGSAGSDTSEYSIQGRRFASNGTPLGSDFQVNSHTPLSQWYPAIAMDVAGNFVAVWESRSSASSDTSGWSIQGRRFASNGTPLGSDFQVNTVTAFSQAWPSVALDAVGNFLVVWGSETSAGSDTSGWSIQGRRFASNGTPLGSDFQVNSYTVDSQWKPVVAMQPTGEFMVAWTSEQSAGGDNYSLSIQGRRFSSNATALYPDFQVNTSTAYAQLNPSIGKDAAGHFWVAWGSEDVAQTATSMHGRQVASNGPPPVGSDFQINSVQPLVLLGHGASTTMNAAGDFAVVWPKILTAGAGSASLVARRGTFSPVLFVPLLSSGALVALGCILAATAWVALSTLRSQRT